MSHAARSFGIGRMLAVVALVTLTVAGRATQAAPARQATSVNIVDYNFNPQSITVAAGSTITFTNTGKATHTASSTTGAFDTGRLSAGQSKSATLNTAGTYAYVCQIHESMTGTIVVTAAQTQASPTPAASAAPAAPTGSLQAKDQPAAGNSITVDSVTAGQDSWVAVHADNGGKPGGVVGQTLVKAGASNNVKVTLSAAPKAGDTYWPMLHVDAGAKGTYEFPGVDAPVAANGAPVMMKITILSGAAAPTSPTLPNTGANGAGMAWWLGAALVMLLAGLALVSRRRGRAHMP